MQLELELLTANNHIKIQLSNISKPKSVDFTIILCWSNTSKINYILSNLFYSAAVNCLFVLAKVGGLGETFSCTLKNKYKTAFRIKTFCNQQVYEIYFRGGGHEDSHNKNNTTKASIQTHELKKNQYQPHKLYL